MKNKYLTAISVCLAVIMQISFGHAFAAEDTSHNSGSGTIKESYMEIKANDDLSVDETDQKIDISNSSK